METFYHFSNLMSMKSSILNLNSYVNFLKFAFFVGLWYNESVFKE